MERFQLMKKLKGKRGGPGSPFTLVYEFPDWAEWIPTGSELAERAAKLMAEAFKRDISSGIDANGKRWEPAPSTIKRRKYDAVPPRHTVGERWAKRFAAGGSKKGATSFNDSGTLVNGIAVRVEGNQAFIDIPGNRAQFVNAAERGAIPIGKTGRRLPVIPLFMVRPDSLDKALHEALFGGGEVIGGLASLAIFAGLGRMIGGGENVEATKEPGNE